MNVARLIDGATCAGGDQDVPVCGEDLRARQARPFAEFQHSQKRVVAGRFRTVAGRKLKVVGFGPHWNDADDAPDGARAIQVGSTAANQLNGVDDRWGELLPVDPTTECIGNGNLIKYHQRAASCGRSKTT